MAGYTKKWDCRICNERQDTDGVPKTEVCSKCLEPLAAFLCRKKLNGAGLDWPGVDKLHFMMEAEAMAKLLFGRWKPFVTRRAVTATSHIDREGM